MIRSRSVIVGQLVKAPLTLLINLVEKDLRFLSLRIGFLEFFLEGLSGISLRYWN
jgi:hypothetical protein